MDDRGSSTPAYRPPRPPRPPPPRAPGPSLPVEAQPRSPPPARARGFECPGGERPRRYPRGRPGGGRFVSRRRLRPLPRMRLARAPGTRSRRAARSETASCRRGTPSPARTQRADGDRRWTAAAAGAEAGGDGGGGGVPWLAAGRRRFSELGKSAVRYPTGAAGDEEALPPGSSFPDVSENGASLSLARASARPLSSRASARPLVLQEGSSPARRLDAARRALALFRSASSIFFAHSARMMSYSRAGPRRPPPGPPRASPGTAPGTASSVALPFGPGRRSRPNSPSPPPRLPTDATDGPRARRVGDDGAGAFGSPRAHARVRRAARARLSRRRSCLRSARWKRRVSSSSAIAASRGFSVSNPPSPSLGRRRRHDENVAPIAPSPPARSERPRAHVFGNRDCTPVSLLENSES